MPLTKEFKGEIARLLIGQKSRLILLEVLILDSDIVERNNHNCLARFVRARFADSTRAVRIGQGEQLVLNQNERLHRMMQGQVVLIQLAKDCTDVKMNLTGVGDAQTIGHVLFHIVEALVLESEGHL